ncbi:hypothetical protein FSP39_022381 [Pinctada imbricata]|uniref:Chitin-binding type-2 domain-containing protein n=1 Tax=Pinctada imbricata TaxID=66713 RepID=A0AA89BZZ2_PINIB|nr:hypothetical protein FSP39_022381 [Pinctada imbricata]
MTQGRDGCCKQWVTKYRVLYSMDCSNNSNSWHTLSGHNVSDVFFKGNSDENTIESHDFDCPVIAKCIRINPLEWHNHISMRFDLLGCHLDTGNGSSSNNNNSSAAATTSGQTGGMTMVSTTSQMTAGSGAGGGSTTLGGAGGSTMPQTTGSGAGQTTGSGSAQPLAGQTTGSGSGQTTGGATTSGATTVSLTTPTTAASNCITTTTGCTGKVDGDYPFCTDCTQYVTCANTILYMRPCPAGLHWNTALSVCDWPNNANCQASG